MYFSIRLDERCIRFTMAYWCVYQVIKANFSYLALLLVLLWREKLIQVTKFAVLDNSQQMAQKDRPIALCYNSLINNEKTKQNLITFGNELSNLLRSFP